FFLFIVGVAIPIALKKRMRDGVTREVYLKIVQRAATIFALGILMSMIPFFQFNDSTGIPYALKIVLVLSFSAALLLYLLEKKTAAAITAAASATIVLVFYFAGAEIVWYNFSTIPAIVTTLSGVLTGTWLMRSPRQTDPATDDKSEIRNPKSEMETAAGLFFAGTVLLAIGWSWSLLFPLNKSLWTSSYVVYTS